MKIEKKLNISYSKKDVEVENLTLIEIFNKLGYKVTKKYYSIGDCDYLKITVNKIGGD